MQPLDILLCIPLGWAIWAGWQRGLLVELMNTAGLLLAVLAGFMLLDAVLLLLRPIFGQGMWLPIVAFFGIAFGVFFISRKLALYTRRAIRKTLLGDLDTAAGALVGMLKMALTISTFIWVLGILRIQLPARHTQDTFVYPALKKAGPATLKGLSFVVPFAEQLPSWIEAAIKGESGKRKPIPENFMEPEQEGREQGSPAGS